MTASTIYQMPIPIVATNNVYPNVQAALFGDNLATVTTAGYLGPKSLLEQGDIVSAFYNWNPKTRAGTYGLFQVAVSGGVITLSEAAVGSVNAGTINQLPYYAAAGNSLSPLGPLTNGQLLVGSTGAAPVAAAITAGNAVSVTNAAGAITLAYTPIRASGTESSNAVTASGQVGVITTSALTTAAGSSYAITWTNTSIASTSVILLSLMGGTNTVNDNKFKVVPGSGSATITIYNTDPTNALNGTILIGYAVL